MLVKSYSLILMFFSFKDFVSLYGLFFNSWVIWNIGVLCVCNWNKRLVGLVISVDLSFVGCFVMCFWEIYFFKVFF